jgi:dTDP-4-amino-4,6-dideoxygalactose transaminase
MNSNLTRRRFLATSSAAVAASRLSSLAATQPANSGARLAVDGGEKAVKSAGGKLIRWGDPERQRLSAMLDQPALFYWKGPQTAALIERVRRHHPMKHVMTCSSGTAALHIAVAAAGIGPGDEVITTGVTDQGTVIGILFQQAVPVFADLEADTANLSVEAVARAITPKTKAIIAVHLTGNPCDLQGLKALADRHGLVLIEDCAQAWGAKYRGQPVGTMGHIACFSLQNSKHVTCGDGGVVGSNDERFGPLLQRFGDKGMDRLAAKPFDSTAVLGTNYRMSEPQAAVAAAQLDRLEAIAARRARLGELLTAGITGVPGIVPPRVNHGDRATCWFYMFMLNPGQLTCTRQIFAQALQAEGAPAGAGYISMPIYKLPVFQQHAFFAGRWPVKELGLTRMDYTKVSCPTAESILERCMRITLHEAMSEAYIEEVAAAVRKVAQHYAKA